MRSLPLRDEGTLKKKSKKFVKFLKVEEPTKKLAEKVATNVLETPIEEDTKEVAGQKVFLATQERGDVFGEMSLLTSQPRHSTCVATAPTRLVAIKSGELLMKLRRDPTFALEMLQQMSRRISYLEEQVSRLTEQELTWRQELARIVAKSTHRSE